MDELSHCTSIERQDGQALPGCLGLLLSDESSDDVVALTAGQVARGSDPVHAHGYRIGICSHDVDRSFDGKARRPAWTLLEIVRLDKDVLLARPSTVLPEPKSFEKLSLPRDILDHLGEKVLVHGGSLAPREGLLRSIHALFRMPAPDDRKPTLFTDALLITSLDGEPLSREGDAGALVTSMHGDCLGIVVAGLDDTSFAAPMAPLLVDDALRPIDDAVVLEWNRRAWTRRLMPKASFVAPPAPEPAAELIVNMTNDDWIEQPARMVDVGRKLAEAAL
ncbi:MAG TPA: hypothetical protein VGB54_02380 [Allosphingosinicella sp.]|jgi:hypothetical protein